MLPSTGVVVGTFPKYCSYSKEVVARHCGLEGPIPPRNTVGPKNLAAWGAESSTGVLNTVLGFQEDLTLFGSGHR